MVQQNDTYRLSVRIDSDQGTQQIITQLAALNRSMAQLERGQAAVAREARLTSAQLQKQATVLNQVDASADSAASSMSRMGRGLRGNQIQNVSYQVQDLAVQLASGAGAARAFGQQLPQMLVGFGAWGAVIGAAVATLGALTPAILGALNASVSYADATERINEALEASKVAQDALRLSTTEMTQRYGDMTVAAREYQHIIATVAAGELREALNTQAGGVRELFDAWLVGTRSFGGQGQGSSPPEVMAAAIRSLSEELDISADAARHLFDRLEALGNAGSMEEQADAARELFDWLQASGIQSEKLPDNFDLAVAKLAQLALKSLEAANHLQRIEDDSNGVTDALERAAAEASRLADNLRVAARSISDVQSATDALDLNTRGLEIQNRVLAEGNDLLDARAAALIDAKRLELNDAFGNEDAAVRAAARIELERYSEALYRNNEAQRENQAAIQAANEAARKTGEARSAAVSGLRQDTQTLEMFRRSLDGYKTDAERARDAMAQLETSFARFGDQLNTEELEVYQRAMQQLAITANELDVELSELGQITQSGFETLFDDLITGTKSAEDAFADMLRNMALDIARFMFSQAVQQFLMLLAQQSGFGWLAAASTVASSAAAGASRQLALVPPVQNQTHAGVGNHLTRVMPSPGVRSASTAQRTMGSGLSVVVNNNAPNTDVEARETTNADGQRTLEIAVERKVQSMVSNGQLDRSMQNAYGIRRRPT